MNKLQIALVACIVTAGALIGCGNQGDGLRAAYTPDQIAAAKGAAPKAVAAFEAMTPDEKSEFMANGGPRKIYMTLGASGDSALKKRFQSDMASMPTPTLRRRDPREILMQQRTAGHP